MAKQGFPGQGETGGMAQQAQGSAPRDDGLDAEAVTRWLRDNPDYLDANIDRLLDLLPLPSRDLPEGVIDMQGFVLDRQQHEIKRLRRRVDRLVGAVAANTENQKRIHRAALRLMEAPSLEALVGAVATELAPQLRVDLVVVALERSPGLPAGLDRHGLRLLEKDAVTILMGGGPALLQPHCIGSSLLYGDAAPQIASQALLRIRPLEGYVGLLGFASRDADMFHPEQAVEHVQFLAATVERLLGRWLSPHAAAETAEA